MRKIIGYKFKKAKGLVKPMCEDMPEVKKIKFTDREIGGVTYRVWSAFSDEINAADSLENLMLNRLESDEIEKQLEPDIESENDEIDEQEEQEFPTLKM